MRLWNEFSWFSLVRSTEGRLANWTIEWASVFRLASTHPSMWIVVECKANPKWLTPNAISLLNEHYYYSITPPNTVNSTSSSNDTRRHLCDENDQEKLNYSFCLFAKWCRIGNWREYFTTMKSSFANSHELRRENESEWTNWGTFASFEVTIETKKQL